VGRLGPYSLLLLAAAAAFATGWLIPRLPGGWAVALGLFALALVLAILVRELSRAVPGELHLARARLGLKAKRAPSIYIRRLFDSYAQRYDRHLFTELDYQVPNLLRDLVDGRVQDGALDIADLGCGTGALGPLFRRLARRLDGVDLSPAMLGHADVRGVYDELVEGDLLAFLLERTGRYDLLLAADVLPYLGDPAPLLAAASSALRPGGLLALSVEECEGRIFVLTRSGRFAHDSAGLGSLAATFRFKVVAARSATLRHEAGIPVRGALLLVQKSAP
jgi:predicted TPR repeat methyltransferase